MLRLATATLALLVTIAPAGAQDVPRFQLVPDGEGFVRFDTHTGDIVYCRPAAGTWECLAVSTPGAPAVTTGVDAAVAELQALVEGMPTDLGARLDRLEAAIAAVGPADLASLRDVLARMEAQLAALAEANATIAAALREIIGGPTDGEAVAGAGLREEPMAPNAPAAEQPRPFGEELVRRLDALIGDLGAGLPP